jgi:hypothetical protein
MHRLRGLFDRLQQFTIRVRDYRDTEAFDAAFDMTTAEHHRVLYPARLQASTLWVSQDGSSFDLTPWPGLLEWAEVIEAVRQECLKHV